MENKTKTIIKSYKLQDISIANKYEKEIGNKLASINYNNKGTIDEIWHRYKTIILEAAEKVCGTIRQSNTKNRQHGGLLKLRKRFKIRKQYGKHILTTEQIKTMKGIKHRELKLRM